MVKRVAETVYTSQCKTNTENSHGIGEIMSQYYAQKEFGEITVQLVSGIPHWFRSLRTPHYFNVQQQGHHRCHFLGQNH